MSHQDELTLKEILENTIDYIHFFGKKWSVIFFTSVISAVIFIAIAYLEPIKYSATLSFMVNEDDTGSSMSSMPSILGQFGFVGTGGGKYNRNKILELSKSRKITTLVLFEQVSINNKLDYLANHILNEYSLVEKWSKKEKGFVNFKYSHSNLDSFSRRENKALLKLYRLIVGNEKRNIEGLVSGGYNEETGILNFSGLTENEDLSLFLTILFYEKLSEYYIEKTIEKQRSTFEVFKSKVDSLEKVLDATNYAILKFDDSSRNLTLKQYQAKRYKLQGEATKLTVAYTEAYKNLQIAELALENRTPFITTIDKPITPLQIERQSMFKFGIIGFILGCISTIIFYSFVKFFNEL